MRCNRRTGLSCENEAISLIEDSERYGDLSPIDRHLSFRIADHLEIETRPYPKAFFEQSENPKYNVTR